MLCDTQCSGRLKWPRVASQWSPLQALSPLGLDFFLAVSPSHTSHLILPHLWPSVPRCTMLAAPPACLDTEPGPAGFTPLPSVRLRLSSDKPQLKGTEIKGETLAGREGSGLSRVLQATTRNSPYASPHVTCTGAPSGTQAQVPKRNNKANSLGISLRFPLKALSCNMLSHSSSHSAIPRGGLLADLAVLNPL